VPLSTDVTRATVLSVVLYTIYPTKFVLNVAPLSTSLFGIVPSVTPLVLAPDTLGILMVSLGITFSARSTCSF